MERASRLSLVESGGGGRMGCATVFEPGGKSAGTLVFPADLEPGGKSGGALVTDFVSEGKGTGDGVGLGAMFLLGFGMFVGGLAFGTGFVPGGKSGGGAVALGAVVASGGKSAGGAVFELLGIAGEAAIWAHVVGEESRGGGGGRGSGEKMPEVSWSLSEWCPA